jgi:mannonate dehydratase
VVTALHHVPVGEIWTTEEINKENRSGSCRNELDRIESLPVHEDIKKQNGRV